MLSTYPALFLRTKLISPDTKLHLSHVRSPVPSRPAKLNFAASPRPFLLSILPLLLLTNDPISAPSEKEIFPANRIFPNPEFMTYASYALSV
ncbi:hypothetical protein GWI33_014836 [Rhynchophorus ferrugineus]|uniref:Uncharacterized protein n=1 Tax=Rhynchophorus ferrugineus TaxID=354439 RepID=A0A834I527_RHYFE|nr:hypothetical protein GWI33_014836 [Rhynchophorus ferrugineus]